MKIDLTYQFEIKGREIYIGFINRKKWPGKSFWSCGTMYYDGTYYYLNIGWFCFSMYY